ncbi:MAG TPA: peptidoglycan-binding protein LysM [Beijerinckiaceae bacterium]|nr:peptidoglycan-binding protein LysM [Beijerinckiaceae bacterium]
MGLFSFAKSVGAKLFGASEAKAATADELKKEVEKHGLKADGLSISVDGDKVKVSGNAMSQADAEKIILALGNTIGVAQVDSALIAKQSAPESRMYTVVKGDNLWKIAEAMYGKGKGAEHERIFEANKPMLTHPDKIYPGQVLRIPPL